MCESWNQVVRWLQQAGHLSRTIVRTAPLAARAGRFSRCPALLWKDPQVPHKWLPAEPPSESARESGPDRRALRAGVPLGRPLHLPDQAVSRCSRPTRPQRQTPDVPSNAAREYSRRNWIDCCSTRPYNRSRSFGCRDSCTGSGDATGGQSLSVLCTPRAWSQGRAWSLGRRSDDGGNLIRPAALVEGGKGPSE